MQGTAKGPPSKSVKFMGSQPTLSLGLVWEKLLSVPSNITNMVCCLSQPVTLLLIMEADRKEWEDQETALHLKRLKEPL